MLIALLATTAGAEPLTFEAAVRATMTRNERAGIAEQNRQAVAARVAGARAAFLPSLTLTGTYTRRSEASVREVGGEQVTIQSANALSSNATLTMTIFDARTIPLYRQALRESEAQDARSANTIRLLGFEAAGVYLGALSSAQVVEAARRRVELARAVRDVARARYDAQLVRSIDVTRGELEVANAEQVLTQAQGELTNARLSLAYLVGLPVEGELVEPAELLTAAAAAPADARAQVPGARDRRLDVVAGRRQAEALRESAREPLFRYIPSVGLSGQARATNEAGLSGRALDWSISVVATWRIFDGGLGLADRRERLALASAATLEADALARGVELDVGRAVVALETGQAGTAQAAVALEAAQKNVREIELLYRQGLTTSLEVADAAVQLFEAEINAIRARYTVALAFLDVRAALGQDALGGSGAQR